MQQLAAAERASIMYLVSIAGGNRERPQAQASGTLLHANRLGDCPSALPLYAYSLTKTAIAKKVFTLVIPEAGFLVRWGCEDESVDADVVE